MLIHSVYFWLEDDVAAAEREQFTERLAELTNIDVAERGHYGPPAGTEARAVVDDSYDYGLVVVCDDVAAHDAYQEHPVHQRFLEACSDLWKEVKVFDVEVDSGV